MISRRIFLRNMALGGLGLISPHLWGAVQSPSVKSIGKPNGSASIADPYGSQLNLSLPPRGDIRLVVMSDLNSAYGSVTYEPEVHEAIALIQSWKPDLVICGGDMVAGQSKELSTTQLQAMWDSFDAAIAQPLIQSRIPFGFTLGNHDASGYRNSSGAYVFDRDRTAAKTYWSRLTSDCGLQFVDQNHFPFYYTFTQNNIFYLVWDATTAELTPDQLNWVESSLANAQAATLRVVIGHLPLYAVAVGRNKVGEILNRAEDLRAMLIRHRVDTYISGHQHAYYPGQKGPLKFLHAGALGGGPRQLIGSSQPPYKSLTVVDVNSEQKATHYTTFDLSNRRFVNPKVLPDSITGVNGTIERQK